MPAEVPRPQLGAHAESLIADNLDKREESIISGVCAKLPSLTAQEALTAWIQIDEARKLRNSLIKRASIAQFAKP